MNDDAGGGSPDADVDRTAEPPPPYLPPEARSGALPPAPARRGRRRTGVVGAVVLVLIAAGVAAVSLSGREDPNRSGAASSRPSVNPSPSRSVAAPSGLSADASGPFRVTLHWGNASDPPPDYVTVSRNGQVVATLPGTTHRWVDATAVPTERYRYAVRAVGDGGAESSAVTTAVKMPKAPLADARVVGVYQATMTVTSKYGYSSLPSTQKVGWRFLPVCEAGSCDVQWQVLHVKDFLPRLNRTGASYKGGASAKYNTVCSGVTVASSLRLELHATRADVVRDAWVATELSGTFTERTGAQLGCVGSGAAFSVKAKLYR